MKPHFYSHIIELNSLHASLDELGLTIEEKTELIMIVESSIHHVVIDTVLSELPDHHKKKFLSHLGSKEHDQLWELLNTAIDQPEEKIKKAVHELKTKLHEDIKEARKKK